MLLSIRTILLQSKLITSKTTLQNRRTFLNPLFQISLHTTSPHLLQPLHLLLPIFDTLLGPLDNISLSLVGTFFNIGKGTFGSEFFGYECV